MGYCDFLPKNRQQIRFQGTRKSKHFEIQNLPKFTNIPDSYIFYVRLSEINDAHTPQAAVL
jgi:hypothetical protein